MMLARTSKGAVRSDKGISSWAAAEDDGFSELRSAGNWMNTNPALQIRRPTAMIGIDQSSMRLLPTRSIRTSAAQVMRKFVTATESDVNVGLEKPRMVKIVAEKYIKEFCDCSCQRVISQCVTVCLQNRRVVVALAKSMQ